MLFSVGACLTPFQSKNGYTIDFLLRQIHDSTLHSIQAKLPIVRIRFNFSLFQGKKWSEVLSRRKITSSEAIDDSKLARVLGLVDLTSLGVGATLGLGVYVLAGAVARTTAGPAVTISFLIAAIASALAGKYTYII